MARSVPLSRFTSQVGGGSAFFVRRQDTHFMELHKIKSDDDAKAYWAEWESRRIHYKPLLEPRVIYWFVHPSTKPPTPLGFLRVGKGSCIIIGGLTGLVGSGDEDVWWNRLNWVLSSGYIPIEEAIEFRHVSPDWSPPPLSDWDAKRVSRLQEHGDLPMGL